MRQRLRLLAFLSLLTLFGGFGSTVIIAGDFLPTPSDVQTVTLADILNDIGVFAEARSFHQIPFVLVQSVASNINEDSSFYGIRNASYLSPTSDKYRTRIRADLFDLPTIRPLAPDLQGVQSCYKNTYTKEYFCYHDSYSKFCNAGL